MVFKPVASQMVMPLVYNAHVVVRMVLILAMVVHAVLRPLKFASLLAILSYLS